MKRKEAKESYNSSTLSGGLDPQNESYNYNSAQACAREEDNPVPVDVSSDPIEIAVRAFHGNRTNRRLWRWYLNMMRLLEKDIDQAETEFNALVYDTRREIVVDAIPPAKPGQENLHARIFHRKLRDYFAARYGTVKCPWKTTGNRD